MSFRRVVFAVVLTAVVSFSAAADDKPADVVRMSPYEVSANSVKFQHWIKLGSPHFILYTDASVRQATEFLRESEMMHTAVQQLFRRKAVDLSPTVIVLPTEDSDWRKIQSKGSVEWEVAVSDSDDLVTHLVLVQYDWQEYGASIVRAAIGQRMIAELNIVGPFWFGHGIGEFFETVEFDENSVTFGRQNPRTAALQWGWMPWEKFFRVTPTSPEFTKEKNVSQFSAQTAMFLQYLLTHPDRVWFNRLLQWAAILEADNDPTEEKFKDVFGEDWKTWQKRMETYKRGGQYTLTTVRLAPGVAAFEPQKFSLPVREMRELFVLSQIGNQKIPASEKALDLLLEKGLKTECLRELLIETCLDWKRVDAAQAQLERLIAEGSSRNPTVYSEAAKRLFDARVPKITLDARIGEEAARIRLWCGKALEIEPHLRDANELLAWTEALAEPFGRENCAPIEKIYRTQAGNAPMSQIVAALTVARWRAGDSAWVKSMCPTLLNSPLVDKPAKEILADLFAKVDGGIPPAKEP